MKKEKVISSVLATVCLVAFISDAKAITRRSTTDDSAYVNLALDMFGFSGMITGPWLGSGVLISPNWVLTAGHCINTDQPLTYTFADGTSRSIVETVFYSGLDLGLARLDTPVTNITPVKLYSLDFGLDSGRECYISGAGNTGTGETGEIIGTAGTCRAATNWALYSADVWGWSSNELLSLFRNDEGGASELEGGSAHGDSGGGLYFDINGEMCVDGILSYAWQNSGLYGVENTSGGGFIRTSLFNDWILTYATDATIIPEPMSLIIISLGAVIIRKRQNVYR